MILNGTLNNIQTTTTEFDIKLFLCRFQALAGGHEEGHAHEEPAPGEGLTDEQVNVFKGLTALIGIFIFFFIERIMTIVTDLKRKRREVSSDILQRCPVHFE